MDSLQYTAMGVLSAPSPELMNWKEFVSHTEKFLNRFHGVNAMTELSEVSVA